MKPLWQRAREYDVVAELVLLTDSHVGEEFRATRRQRYFDKLIKSGKRPFSGKKRRNGW